MREFEIEANLRKILSKLHKKEKRRYDILMSKMNEILTCENVEHYKNLRKPLQQFKRVHVNSNFVLAFKYIKNQDLVIFYDFDHHDNIYKKLSK
jgi:YafQ family addiction module toxin component